ncbi:alpha-L-rhamnosidase [Streptomyces sp. BK205]|uniref:alpha-L-rhamnosidase n=1 Tax=Streptomyces sp. BK205 TaxID=2512164 RepID=UPI001048E3E4|nr:alpha-L-rhamnosidase [Streptomyces sp. BK205]TCR26263.1 alpha-L-rhamnosidase [Streptomyces sp. BK205]
MPIESSGLFIARASATGEEGDPASYFRREFILDEAPLRATLRVTALGVVEPHVNGTAIGDEVLAPGWTSYRNRLVVSDYDVTDRLEVGANAFGAIVGDGWAVGRLGWEGKRHHYADRPALFAELILDYSDRIAVIASGPEFRAAVGGVRGNSLYDGESYDARLEPAGWDRPGFDDTQWESVAVVPWPSESLTPAIAEPIRRVEELAPVEVVSTPSGRTVLDFGQNISGRIRFTVSAEPGTAITLRHAEVMTDGELDTETLRTAKATDRFIAAGGGPEDWEPRFTFHGFRYVEVDGWPGKVDPDAFRAVVTHSDMRRTGWLETSDALLNQLHSNAVWSMRDNFVGVPTDCPQRDERLGWTGDLNAFAPAAAFLYDVRGVLGSWLRDLAAEQREKGFVPWVVPDVLSTPSSPTALWSDVAVSLPWTLYREYGDESILREAYPSMTAFIRQVAALLDEGGLWSSGFQYGDWLDPDAPMDNPAGGKTDRHLVASAYLCRTTREMADTAQVLGHEADAAEFRALAQRVREAFRREYVTETGRVAGETVTGYALAIAFSILDDAQRRHAGDLLAQKVAKAAYRISTGFAGTPLVTDALSSTGHLAEAYLLLQETGCPSFLYPVMMGATTIWERWDSIRPDGTINPSGMTSLNHYALGAVVDWMHRTIGGLTAIEPGYRRMRIAPLPGGDLTSARLRHATPQGDVEVAWELSGRTVSLAVTVPEHTTAEVVLPLHPDGETHHVAGGAHAWSYELPAGAGPRHFSLDSTLKELADDPAAWRAFTDAFAVHFPGVPLDGAAPEAAFMTVETMLGYVPGASPELRADLASALAAVSQGAHA